MSYQRSHQSVFETVDLCPTDPVPRYFRPLVRRQSTDSVLHCGLEAAIHPNTAHVKRARLSSAFAPTRRSRPSGNSGERPWAAPRECGTSNPRLVVAFLLPRGLTRAADLPDHPGARDLDERTVTSTHELCIRVRLAEVPHGAVVDD